MGNKELNDLKNLTIEVKANYEERAQKIRQEIDVLWEQLAQVEEEKRIAMQAATPLTINDLTEEQIMCGVREYLNDAAQDPWDVFDKYLAIQYMFDVALTADQKDLFDRMSYEQQNTLHLAYREQVKRKLSEVLGKAAAEW